MSTLRTVEPQPHPRPPIDAARDGLAARLRAGAAVFGPELARLARARGLAVTQPDGSTAAIPIAATPVVLEMQELKRRQRAAALLSAAALKMSRAALGSAALGSLVLDGLSPLEAELAQATFRRLQILATTRVDFFADAYAAKALEINATIPAMQGYSDIAAHTLLDVVGRFAGAPARDIARWQASNGSNAQALHDALQSGYRKLRPGRRPTRAALLCRRNDAQLTELQFLAGRFRALGTDADVVYPDELVLDDDAVGANRKSYDLVYRHLFIRRLEDKTLAGAGAVRALLADENGRRAVVLNPPASQVELKSVFALLSQALEDPALAREAGLSDEELATIQASVPWTRMFRGQALQARVAADPDRYVLKRAWDYGGRAVFLGRSRHVPAFDARVQAAWPGPRLDWSAVCAQAAVDARGGGFVVQELVDARPEAHLLCGDDGQRSVDLYVDFSSYASVGLDVQPAWGGVCRGSPSSVVNIMGGGGLVPLLTGDVARELLGALPLVH